MSELEQVAAVVGFTVLGLLAVTIVIGVILAYVTTADFDRFLERNNREMAELKNEIANLKRIRKG